MTPVVEYEIQLAADCMDDEPSRVPDGYLSRAITITSKKSLSLLTLHRRFLEAPRAAGVRRPGSDKGPRHMPETLII
jgi:hypothetical protein